MGLLNEEVLKKNQDIEIIEKLVSKVEKAILKIKENENLYKNYRKFILEASSYIKDRKENSDNIKLESVKIYDFHFKVRLKKSILNYRFYGLVD